MYQQYAMANDETDENNKPATATAFAMFAIVKDAERKEWRRVAIESL